MQSIIAKSQSDINYKLAARRKEDSNQVTDWIEEILDASMGYKKAHNWTRPTIKAPPLPTYMWKKGKYISHPHDMCDVLLKEWGSIWTQQLGDEMATKMWDKIRQLIITSRKHNKDMDDITEEDVKRGIKMMSSGTAVGIDQWSPGHWKQLSPEAIEAITHLFNHIQNTWGMAWAYIYIKTS